MPLLGFLRDFLLDRKMKYAILFTYFHIQLILSEPLMRVIELIKDDEMISSSRLFTLRENLVGTHVKRR